MNRTSENRKCRNPVAFSSGLPNVRYSDTHCTYIFPFLSQATNIPPCQWTIQYRLRTAQTLRPLPCPRPDTSNWLPIRPKSTFPNLPATLLIASLNRPVGESVTPEVWLRSRLRELNKLPTRLLEEFKISARKLLSE